jgi:nicotinate-nucleotide--dimethylbenzimidazole phosphoribosyltransferase
MLPSPSDNVDFLEANYRKIFPQDLEYRDRAVAHLEQLTMPHWALGDLMDLAVDLAGMTRSLKPQVKRKKARLSMPTHSLNRSIMSGITP